MKQKDVTNHFNQIAKDYDFYKKRNLFGYYSTLKNKIKNLVPSGSKVLDYGCGTGEILSILSPRVGVGYDPSIEMVKIAEKKFNKKKNLTFVNKLTEVKGNFDYIFLADVIEHLPNLSEELLKIKKLMTQDTKLVMSFVDSSWEWFPKMLELLNLKMSEGPHKRISYQEVIKISETAGFEVVKQSSHFSPIKILVLTHPKKD